MSVNFCFYIETMPCEAAAAALFGLIDGVVCIGQKIEQTTESFDSILKPIQDQKTTTGTEIKILLLGTYWRQAAIAAVSCIYPNAVFTTYMSNLTQGPVAFVCEYAKSIALPTNLFTILVQNFYADALHIIDCRFLGKNIVENQAFFTGLFNHSAFDPKMSNFDRFQQFFRGKVTFAELIKTGAIIVDSQLALCVERAEKNSRTVRLASGQLATVTNGSDLINLTHEALHKKTETPVTIVLTLKFPESSNKTEIAYSVRSHDEKISAIDLISKLPVEDPSKVGGNALAAGGRIPIDVPLQF